MEYSRGLLAPLCSDLRELPRAGTLQARMASIALEQGLAGGVSDDAVYALLFAMEVIMIFFFVCLNDFNYNSMNKEIYMCVCIN